MAWFDEVVPADLTVDVGGKATPARELEFVKSQPDFATFLKSAVSAHQEVGARIPVKVDAKDTKAVETWRKDHLPKLYDAGILARPPADPKEYDIKPPADIPAGLVWNEERAGRLGQLGIKHGLTKAAMDELRTLHQEALSEGIKAFDTSYEAGIEAMKKEFGDQTDARMEEAKQVIGVIFRNADGTPDIEARKMFDDSGFADYPGILRVLMRLAPLMKQDSSYMEALNKEGTAAGAAGNEQAKIEAREYLQAIMYDTKHPDHLGWLRGDPAVKKKADDLYEKAYGKGQVEIASTPTILAGTGR